MKIKDWNGIETECSLINGKGYWCRELYDYNGIDIATFKFPLFIGVHSLDFTIDPEDRSQKSIAEVFAIHEDLYIEDVVRCIRSIFDKEDLMFLLENPDLTSSYILDIPTYIKYICSQMALHQILISQECHEYIKGEEWLDDERIMNIWEPILNKES